MAIKIDNPNVKTCWERLGVNRAGDLEKAVVVETDLVVYADRKGYDDTKFQKLVAAVVAFMKGDTTVDRAYFHSLKDDGDA